ncbi:glycoside hydrolase family 108 protein [Mesorhizobium australafricanum]|uniref:Glycosyl hydrolase 108 family protein n=1 Tax=Mesorhizobium australafricanum TaxID=3072311 RepID=A0ABU4WQN9_9HYPH|nr:glycosyl hydrolase 108 family protein [Mesorhizobium sp. VK3E]MDX8438343.1 glycosyl hydrolase 108 family protein [Mesorhizobium sp. VK3E]
MDRNFARALALVLKSEGGWSDNPADPGGATMKGVTLANFRRYVKADATKADLRKITDEQCATVYRRFYWDAIAGAELPDGVDYAVFDFAVNSGPGRAAKYLQAACGPSVSQDGRIGPATLAAVHAKPPAVIIDTLCDARLKFLERLPTWPSFGRGWQSRVTAVRVQALLMTTPTEQPAQPAPDLSNTSDRRPEPAPPPAYTTAYEERNPFWAALFAILKAIFGRKPA